MKSPHATTTPDMLPNHDLAGERPPKPTQREKTAARLAKMRAEKNKLPFTVNINADVKRGFDKWLADHPEKTRNDVVEKLIRTQLLRKR